ncbi:unnamed protein product [Choristocarpus tenellus]
MSPMLPPDIKITGIEFSPGGDFLLVWGEHYIGVACLPSLGACRHRSSAAAATAAVSRRRQGGEGFLWDMSGYAVDKKQGRVMQASWNPLSDECLTILTVTDGRRSGQGAGASIMLHIPGRAMPEKVWSFPLGPLGLEMR